MKDTEISRLFKIPYSTIAEWKREKNKDTWRGFLYIFLKSFTKEQLEDRIENIKALRK